MRIISELNAPILSMDLNDKSTSVDGQRLKPEKNENGTYSAKTYSPSTSPQSKLAWIVSMFDVDGENITVHPWTNSEATKMFVPSGNSYTINTNMMMFIDGAIVVIEKEDVQTFNTASGNCVYVVYDHANKTCNFPTYSVEQAFSVEEWKKTIYLGKFNGSNIVLNDDAYKKPPAEDSEAIGGVSIGDIVLKTDLVITDDEGNKDGGEWFDSDLWPLIIHYLKEIGLIVEEGEGNYKFNADYLYADGKYQNGSYFLDYDNMNNVPAMYQPAGSKSYNSNDRAIYISTDQPSSNLRDGDIWLQYYN